VYNFSSLVNSASISLSGTLNGPSTDGTSDNQQDSFITNSAVGASIATSGTANIHVRGTGNTTGFICGANTYSYTGTSNIFTYGASLINFGSLAENFDNITVSSGSLNITSSAGSSINYIATGLTVSSGASATLLSGTYDLSNAPGLSNSGTFTNATGVSLTVGDLVLSSASTSFTNNGLLQVYFSFTNNKGSSGFVSGSSSTVDFISGFTKNINASSAAFVTAFNHLTHSGASALGGSGSFSVAGDYNNTSGFADAFIGNTVTFSGTGTLNGGSAGTTFNNITNTSGTRTASGVVNLAGILSVAGGTFNTGGSSVFTLKSTSAAATGSIATIGGTLTGDVTIERYLSSGTSWKYLGFPFSSALAVSDLQAAGFKVNGHYASNSGSDAPGIIGESFYVWTSGEQAWNGLGYGLLNTSATSLNNKTGYSAYAYASGASTLTLKGTPTQGAVNITLNASDNLIPNPYPAPLDFSKVLANRSSTVGTLVAVQTNGGVNDGTADVLAYTDGVTCTNCLFGGWKGEIALGQSFWITSPSGGTLALTESDKVASGNATFTGKTESSSATNYLRVALISNKMRDESLIFFSANGSDKLNSRDAVKYRLNGSPSLDGVTKGSYINLSTLKQDSDKPMVFNYMPLLDCQTGSKSVRLNVADITAGDHSLKFSDLETFSLGYAITLNDKFLNKQTAVLNGFTYSFSTSDNSASYGSNRFELRFDPLPVETPTITIAGTQLTTVAKPVIQWYKNGKLIEGATKTTYTVTETGVYTVKSGYSSVCQAESLPSVLTITGIDKEQPIISSYPNPTSDIVNISYPSTMKIDKVYLFTSKGETLSNLDINFNSDNTLSLDLTNQNVGLYILQLKSGSATYSIKILKK
jgi:hypothetical protein